MKHKTGGTLSLLLALALLVGLLPGMSITAHALELSESFDTVTATTYTGEHFTITSERVDIDGIYCRALSPVRIDARNGETITRIDLTIGCYGGYGRTQYLSADHGLLSYTTEEDGDVISFVNVNSTSIVISSSVSEYLQFSRVVVYCDVPDSYTVSFAPNGGSGSMTDVSVTEGSTYCLPACGFIAPANQQFKAWSYNGQEYAVGTPFQILSDAIFTAVWEDIPAVTYSITMHPGANGAAGVSPNPAEAGTVITVNCVPFQGYVVSEILWSADGGVTKTDITDTASFVMPAANADVWVNFAPAAFGFGGFDSWDDGGYAAGQRAWKVKLAPMVNGSAALGILSGESTTTEFSVYPATTIYVFPNANPGYTLDKIIWSYIDGTASYDITETKNFVMPAMDVVVYVAFKPLAS